MRTPRLVTGFLVLAAATAARAADPGYGLPHDASLDGHRVDELIHFTIWATGLLFAVMVAWMLVAVFRHGPSHVASPARGDDRRSAIGVLVLAALIFLVVDGNLFFHSVSDLDRHFWNYAVAEQSPGAVLIEVNAHQWAWDLRYAGPDGQFNTADDVVSLNDMRIPVDTPVVLQIASTDVLHSLYLPNFRVKQDAVPGTVTRLWFQAKETGVFEIGCAQHCGPNHYKMRGVLTVLPRGEYDAWLASASADGRRGWDPDDTAAHWGWAWRRTEP